MVCYHWAIYILMCSLQTIQVDQYGSVATLIQQIETCGALFDQLNTLEG